MRDIKKVSYCPMKPGISVFDTEICTYMESMGIDMKTFYEDHRCLYTASKKVKEIKGSLFFELPFCHTLEAEALGAHIRYDDGWKNPRSGECRFDNIEILKKYLLESVYNRYDDVLNTSRINSVLDCISFIKSKGERVSFEITGVFTVLDCMVDLNSIYKGLIKDNETVFEILDILGDLVLEFVKLLISRGVDIISISDSPADIDIIGPRSYKLVYDRFYKSFFKKLQSIYKNTAVFICPHMSKGLINIEVARYISIKEIDSSIDVDMDSKEALGIAMLNINKSVDGFFSGICFANKDLELPYKNIKILDIIER